MTNADKLFGDTPQERKKDSNVLYEIFRKYCNSDIDVSCVEGGRKMTEKEYRQHPAISRSSLWKMSESPEKFKYALDNPDSPTPSLIFGQMVHKLLLQPEEFESEFAVAPIVDRRTQAGKQLYQQFMDESEDKTVVSYDDFSHARLLIEKIRSIPFLSPYIKGRHEEPFFWIDPDTGEECKVRCDILVEINGILTIVDYKSAASAETGAFNSAIFRHGYHLQAAMYTEGVKRAMNLDEAPEFVFLVQEKNPPYAVNLVAATDDIILAGMDVFREYLGIYHQCKETGYWYGYNGAFDMINEAYLPGYMQLGAGGEEDE